MFQFFFNSTLILTFLALFIFSEHQLQASSTLQKLSQTQDSPFNEIVVDNNPTNYSDARSNAKYRLQLVFDQGTVLNHSTDPNQVDGLGARDVWVFHSGSQYLMHYDAAGPQGWLASLAVSNDLIHWTKKGAILGLGNPGAPDSASASYGTTFYDNGLWHMFYLGTPNATADANRVPVFPYLTLKAVSCSPYGPWVKTYAVRPLTAQPNTFYSVTSSPGYIIKYDERVFLQFFSAATKSVMTGQVYRTIGLAWSNSLSATPWNIDQKPILPVTEQIENASIYYQKSNSTWYLFVNHVGVDETNTQYTDAIWMYWSKDLFKWNVNQKAVVLDNKNTNLVKGAIGLPSVIQAGGQLALFYDGAPGYQKGHMGRDIGLAYIPLPLADKITK